MEFDSPKLIAIILVSVLLGSAGGYLYSSNSYNVLIDEEEERVEALNQEIEKKISEMENLTSIIQEQIEIIDQQSENISALNNEIMDLTSTIENTPNLVEERDQQIDELEEELKDKNFDILKLNERLGDRLRWNTYSKHDMTFEYPDYMHLSQLDYGYYDGQVLYRNYLDPVSYFTFIWMNTADFLEETADEITTDVEDSIFERMIIVESEIYGHTAYIIHYTVSVGDGEYHGIMCIWSCENTGRTMALIHYSSEDPMSMFFECLGTVKCHSEGVIA